MLLDNEKLAVVNKVVRLIKTNKKERFQNNAWFVLGHRSKNVLAVYMCEGSHTVCIERKLTSEYYW